MNPIIFEGTNVVLGQDQAHVNPLPAHRGDKPDYIVTTCYQLSPEEAAAAAATGRIFLQQWTFGAPLQPQNMTVHNPLEETPGAVKPTLYFEARIQEAVDQAMELGAKLAIELQGAPLAAGEADEIAKRIVATHKVSAAIEDLAAKEKAEAERIVEEAHLELTAENAANAPAAGEGKAEP